MSFFKNIFGSNKADQNQTKNNFSDSGDHFVVDENGEAQEVKSTINANENSKTGSTSSEPIEPVEKDTSAFDELMSQAENSVEAKSLKEPVLDPEFQKAQQEASQEGIEIISQE